MWSGTILTIGDKNNTTSMELSGSLIIQGRDILKEIDALKNENEQLKKKIEDMNDIMTQMYYSPPNQGGPGYELAKEQFTGHSYDSK